MFALGEESVAELSYRYGQAVAERRVADGGFLLDHRQAPDDFDFQDPDELRAALADVYGDAAEWMDLERLVAEAYDSRKDVFRRYFLNQPVARSTQWLSPAAWEARADHGYQPPSGTRVVLAFDGSYRLDSSALIGCTVEDRPYLWVVGLWERPPKAPDDWTIDRPEVDAVVRRAMETFDVAELSFDPPGRHAEAERWVQSFGEIVVATPTSHRASMAAACSRFYASVVAGELAHDGDQRLARHIANAVLKETADGAYISKDGKNSPRKIDAVVAAVVAHQRAVWHRDNAPSNTQAHLSHSANRIGAVTGWRGYALDHTSH